MNLSIGAKLGPYEIVASIGAGGMGEVWKARDTRLDRIVALKVSKELFSERFEREARVIASLNHPHIASLYDVGPNYLVMEYVEGDPLRGPLPVAKAMQYAGQICDALDAAHKKGITHRDLKPANILVGKQGIKLLDFGLAKVREEQAVSEETISKALTAQGAVLGTPQYMAPEQVEGKEADARSDIFSLGCVLYEMLTGRKAFGGKNASVIAAAILAKEPEPITGLDPAVERVVKACLAKDPDDRLQSPRDVKLALGWSARPDSERAARGNRLPWAVAIAMGLAFLTVAWLYFRGSQPIAQRAIHFQIQAPEKMKFADSPELVSPDGRTIVFEASSADGKSSLWVRPLDTDTARPLPGTERPGSWTWSPNSRSLAFFSDADKRLKRIEVAGGTPQTICALPLAILGTWNEAGDILFRAPNGQFQRVPASGGVPSDVMKPDAGAKWSPRDPTFLPDGRHFLFTNGFWGDAPGPSIYAASLDGMDGRTLILEQAAAARFMPSMARSGIPGYLFYYGVDGTVLMARPFDPDSLKFSGDPVQISENVGRFSVSHSAGVMLWSNQNPSLSQIVWLDGQGKTLDAIGTPGRISTLSLSPDGKRAAISRNQDGKNDVWTVDLARGAFSRLTLGETLKTYPIWSALHSRIFFSDYDGAVSGVSNLYSISADGGTKELVFRNSNRKIGTDLSRDERFLLYTENDMSSPRRFAGIWAIALDGDKKPFPVVRGEFGASEARFSPDGRWVAYVSDESGSVQVYIKRFPPTEQRWQVSTDLGAAPRWRADGKQLFYRVRRNRLLAVDLKLGATIEVSKPRELFTTPVQRLGDYEPTADGKRFLALIEDQTTAGTQSINVIVNWPATLVRGQK